MKPLKQILTVFALSAFTLLACSKSSDESNDNGGEGGSQNGPEQNQPYDTTTNVYHRLINQYKGDYGSVIVNNENNIVTFGIDFTSSKNGRISKIRANTGYNGTYTVSIWRVGVESDYSRPYKETEIQTNNTENWSGEKEVEGWNIKKDSTYRIGIRVHTKVRRLNQNHGISNATGKIGPLTFGKTFYYNNNGTKDDLPEHVGSYLHFAGFLDFDFIAEN